MGRSGFLVRCSTIVRASRQGLGLCLGLFMFSGVTFGDWCDGWIWVIGNLCMFVLKI